ncbi:hypothetical protein ACFL0I_03565 [Gemmatimonadota bacterium]
MRTRSRVFAPSKVAGEHQKVEAYLRGERIFPTTIELDLTQLCTRACTGCPYSSTGKGGLSLQLPFLDRIFGILGPHTPGLILSGGESTIVPHFAETVALARQNGFKEIAVISNGGHAYKTRVQDALLEHVTSIRFSLYDWQENDSPYFTTTLRDMEALRERIEKEGSGLEIGAAVLTRNEWTHRIVPVGLQALQAGIHWLYFHPYCVDWEARKPAQADQTGVMEAIEALTAIAPEGADIQVPAERYSREPLSFQRLHGAHFLIQIGADGINYAGPECKYDKDSALLDLNEYQEDDFLWHPQRLERLNGLSSDNYGFIGTRHRPPMFSDYIQGLIDNGGNGDGRARQDGSPATFSYPSIL